MTNIINKVRFSYEISDNQNDLFTRNHTRYKCVIRYEGKRYTFEYQCNPSYTKPNKENCLECLLSDASAIECTFDIDDFLKEYGYADSLENIRKGERAYKACIKTYNALCRMFNADLPALREEIENAV